MTPRFTGKIILITGGNSGIGLATARRIVEEGGRVIITGRNVETLQAAVKELGDSAAEAIQSDVEKISDITSLMSSIEKKYKKIDGLFANAGVAKFSPVEQVTEEDFDRMFDINVKGVYFTLQKAIPLLTNPGAVVLNASVAGSLGSATASVYGATKAAVRSMARTFSATYAQQGLRFNVVSPGPIETPIWKNVNPDTKKNLSASNPMKRYGTAEEVAAAVCFLLSSDSSYILGSELFVDGGVTQL